MCIVHVGKRPSLGEDGAQSPVCATPLFGYLRVPIASRNGHVHTIPYMEFNLSSNNRTSNNLKQTTNLSSKFVVIYCKYAIDCVLLELDLPIRSDARISEW
jgi:hypothetical protein